MKTRRVISVLSLLIMTTSIARSQALPTEEPSMSSRLGPNFSPFDGLVHYSLSASEIIQDGYYGAGEITHSTNLSGNLGYNSQSAARPFSILFAGGVLLGNETGQGNTSFWNVAASQGYVTRHWAFDISDTFSFLPQSPTTGLSGIAGVGDLGALPVEGPAGGTAGGVLTTSGDRISNGVSGSVERQLTVNTSISGSGSWDILRYFDNGSGGEGLDSTNVAGTAALNRRLDARSSVSLGAEYSTYSYSGAGSGPTEPGFQTRGLNVSYQRVLSRTLSVNATVGPQWISSSNSTLIPSTLNLSVSGGVLYAFRKSHASVTYTRGASAGSGVLAGAFQNNIYGTVGRTYGRDWAVSLSGSYVRSSGLAQSTPGTTASPSNLNYDTVYGGGQINRRINVHFSGYASYTAQNQSGTNLTAAPVSVAVSPNLLSGFSQTFGVGITFTPRSTSLGQF